MVWLIRYAFLALALVCVVSLLSLVALDAQLSASCFRHLSRQSLKWSERETKLWRRIPSLR